MERVVIFGSTGMTGVCTVEAAVNKGLNTRAFVRDPAKLPDHLRNSVEVVKGDVLNYTDVLNAVTNTTAVIVVLGTRNKLEPTTDLSEGTKNIIKAMKEQKVEIISICLSAFLFYEEDKVPQMFRDITSEHRRQFNLVKESGLKYVAVLPPHISEQKGAEYIINFDSPAPSRTVSKYDLGRFLIDCVTQPKYYEKICGICTKYPE